MTRFKIYAGIILLALILRNWLEESFPIPIPSILGFSLAILISLLLTKKEKA